MEIDAIRRFKQDMVSHGNMEVSGHVGLLRGGAKYQKPRQDASIAVSA